MLSPEKSIDSSTSASKMPLGVGFHTPSGTSRSNWRDPTEKASWLGDRFSFVGLELDIEEVYSFQEADRLRSLVSQRKAHESAPARSKKVTVTKVTEAEIPIHDERRSGCQEYPGTAG
jgi:hypothetical protein